MIIIAFDFGIKKIGVAVGENITKTGRALNIIHAKNGYPNWNIISNLIKIWQPEHAIVGFPLNMNGTRQEITKKSEKFAFLLKNKFNISVKLHDERLSTVEARSLIFNVGGFKELKKKKKNRFFFCFNYT